MSTGPDESSKTDGSPPIETEASAPKVEGDVNDEYDEADQRAARRRRWVGAIATATLFGLGMFSQFGRGCRAGSDASSPAEASTATEPPTGDAPSAQPGAGVATTPPPSPAARAALAEALRLEAAGQLDEADAAAQRAVAAGAVADGQLERAKIMILRKRYGQAREVLDDLLARDPGFAAAHYNLGFVEHQEDRYNAARAHYLRAVKLNPNMKDARYNLALLTFDKGIVAEARHHAAEYAKLAPGTPAAKRLLAKVGAEGSAP